MVQSEESGRLKHMSAFTCLPSRHALRRFMEKPLTDWLALASDACDVGYAALGSGITPVSVLPGCTNVGNTAGGAGAGAQAAAPISMIKQQTIETRTIGYLPHMLIESRGKHTTVGRVFPPREPPNSAPMVLTQDWAES